jgi:hypothetical protein
MEDSVVLKRETELRKRNEDLRAKKQDSLEHSSKICSTEKLDSVITETEITRRSTNAVKKFEKEIRKRQNYIIFYSRNSDCFIVPGHKYSNPQSQS